MAASKVSIANGALQKLGEPKRLESLTQDHPNARSISNAFDSTRDALLRKYDWAFAIARASIAADGDDALWGDWFRYSKPNDYIRLLRDDESGQRVDYKIEGNYILSRVASPLEIRYIARVEDVSSYDTLFIEALEYRIAFVVCEEITGSTSRMAALSEEYDRVVAEAKKWGSIEKGEQDFPEDDWVNARL